MPKPLNTAFITDSLSLDLERALKYGFMWGIDQLVLRSVGDGVVPHVQEKKVRRILEKFEAEVFALFPPLFMEDAEQQAVLLNDAALLQEVLAFCNRMSVDTVLLDAFGGAPIWELNSFDGFLRQIADKAHQAGVRLVFMAQTPTKDWALQQFLTDLQHPSIGVGYVLDALPQMPLALPNFDVLMFSDMQESALLPVLSAGFSGTCVVHYEAEERIKEGLRNSTKLIQSLRQFAQ